METAQHPNGARFYRTLLQLNPFAYLERHAKQHGFASEEDYNKSIVAEVVDRGVEVACVSDHYRVHTGESLRKALGQAGVHALLGFEAVSKDGVHLLCMFDADTPVAKVQSYIGALGVHDETEPSPIGDKDSLELVEIIQGVGGLCVAAHLGSTGGLLRALEGKARANAWRNDSLLAGSLPGPPSQAPVDLRDIVSNRDPAYKRKWPLAIINAQDVSSPAQVGSESCSCLIKMTSPSVEALRQAFLDPGSRIRSLSEPEPSLHFEIKSLSWEGGFLDGISLPLSPNLNCLIGGRGTGKSSAVESIRAVFGLLPVGEEARKRHDAVMRSVIRPGTKIVAHVVVYRPHRTEYTTEVVCPGEPLVRTADGKLSKIRARELVPGLEVYGQHEISEMAGDPRALTALVQRFLDSATDETQRDALQSGLIASRKSIIEAKSRLDELESRLASLPQLEEKRKRFEDAGIAVLLADKAAVIAEEGELSELEGELIPFDQILATLAGLLPLSVDRNALPALDASPLGQALDGVTAAFSNMSTEAKKAEDILIASRAKAVVALSELRLKADARTKDVDKKTAAVLRQLGAGSMDGQDYIRTKKLIGDLSPLKPEVERTSAALNDNLAEREELLSKWAEWKAKEFRELERAAKRVTKALANTVRVTVTFQGDREPLWTVVRGIRGRLAEAIETLDGHSDLTPLALARRIRSGATELRKAYALSAMAAERLAGADDETVMALEELDLVHTTAVELNVAPVGAEPKWKSLADLSAGQRATAVLLLLLLESPAPLVVDQPEDDLDNRFIYDGVVPRMRDEKHKRQFIFATHNANIPVLADAEMIACFQAAGAGSEGRAELGPDSLGSIDMPMIRQLVGSVLEGGSEAFEMRRKKYRY